MGTENNLLLCAKNCPLRTQYCDFCIVENILDNLDIITIDLEYLTASYLNCAKWIGFTVQMYLCMGTFPAVHVRVLVSAGMCVGGLFFSSELPLSCFVWLDCSCHLISTASITFQSECYVLSFE